MAVAAHATRADGFIAFLTLLLSCTGNLSLVALHVAQRRKEISIRKVMGASHAGSIHLVLTSFFKQAAFAFAIPLPPALHREVYVQARREGKSLNQWITEKLAKTG